MHVVTARPRHVAWLAGGCAAQALLLTAGCRALGAEASEARLVRTYTGVATGTAHYARSRGKVTVTLTLATGLPKPGVREESASRNYRALISIRGELCPDARRLRHHCVSLTGALSGEGWDTETHVPDTGGSVHFEAVSERFGALGAVTASCRIYGVGYIRQGRRTALIEIDAKPGAVLITARGPVVPGFSGL
jgi:hypothetical protein